MADMPIRVIATLPTGEIPETLPANAKAVRFLPHAPLLSRAACVVCHGGPGITQKALANGVPVVAIPFALDRFEVARRVEVAKAGVMLVGSRLTAKTLRSAIELAMRRKAGAQLIAHAFAQAGGAAAAATALEELATTAA
jgi:UDP:flavonoid glycosyltransferase YjiC (YdhE family)